MEARLHRKGVLVGDQPCKIGVHAPLRDTDHPEPQIILARGDLGLKYPCNMHTGPGTKMLRIYTIRQTISRRCARRRNEEENHEQLKSREPIPITTPANQ